MPGPRAAAFVCYLRAERMETPIPDDVTLHQSGERRIAVPLRVLATAALSTASAGIVIACLTLRLNPQVHSRPTDALLLMVYLCLGLGLGPLLFAASLPDLGLAGGTLTTLIFSPDLVGKLTMLVAIALLLGTAGLILRPALSALRQKCGIPSRGSLAFGLSAVLGLAIVYALFGAPRATAGEEETTAIDQRLPASPLFDNAPPVVLLCIDGADLDDVILPMVEAGELPIFAQLMVDGTWGELATFAPTLSPAVWTTLVTGKTKEEHGIHGFTVFQLPGLQASILEFPLHSGLNFQLFPLIERLPGMPLIRLPFTSNMRRVPALWNIASRYYPVGIFRWRTTWPVEKVNGFGVASTVTLGETAHRSGKPLDLSLYHHPPDVFEELTPPPGPPGIDAVRPYLKPGVEFDPESERIRFIRSSMRSHTVHYLSLLIRRHQPRFTASTFYSVDAFNHYFGVDSRTGGPFAPAVAERYRFADTRLGELLEALGSDANVIVVSDHGYDFVNNNHTHAPPGIFFARGPAFQPARRVTGLTVFDVAPLVLHLLALPPGQDMPAAASGSVPSWGSTENVALRPPSAGQERMILDELRSLGYIE
ncbi:MAG: alkaline phosphatase family protein [Acidobacteria bacterium]|nr:alkaline phosphatase family protein [Candidatus Sulfomarinibacter kjeldsenii]